MYNLRHLAKIGEEGLSDLLPAVRQAFNEDPTDDRLDQVYGPRPRRTILALSVVGVVVGGLLVWLTPTFPFKDDVNWSAVIVGLIFATAIRRYLFETDKADVQDFPWLAASMIPAVVLLMAVAVISDIAFPDLDAVAGPTAAHTLLGIVLLASTDALGVAAALAIAVAALCFSRRWPQALWDLAVRLFVFKLMVWITALVILEIGIVGPIITVLLDVALGVRIPAWIPDLADQLSYAGLMSVVYLAVIGATWTVCRRSFSELLETGEVHVLETIADLARDPKQKERHEKRKRRKLQKRAGR